MFDTSQPLRHLPFFTELASAENEDSAWRAVSAGLVLLRLVDAWVEEGSAVVEADSWGVRSVRAAIDEMPAGMPARAILSSAMDALVGARASDIQVIAPRLMAYARSLDLDAKWSLAADVYETVLAHVHPEEESEIAVNALLRRGRCLREIGDFADAMHAFALAGQLAHKSGDLIGTLKARIGEAKIVVARGNLPAADEMLRETVERASEHQLAEVRSIAMHDRAFIAHERRQYDLAIRYAYDAMGDSVTETERDRILGDLAGSFYMLGLKSAARDAFLILAATAREQWQRWVATINLMELSAEDSAEVQFERYRQQLDGAGLPPLLQAQFEMHVGRGLNLLGRHAKATSWLERALATASRHRFNQLIFSIESELETRTIATGVLLPNEGKITREVISIAEDLKNLRELASV